MFEYPVPVKAVVLKLSAKVGAAVGSEAKAKYKNLSALAFQEESSLEILNPVVKKSTASSVDKID